MKKIPRTVLILGAVSFFTDVSSEMIYPLLPLYLSTHLGATPAGIGLIEGFAELVAAWMKLYSGKLADRSQNKKKLVFVGYSLSALMRPLIGIAASWPTVLLIRAFDRIGKGVRSSPRDAIIAEVTHHGHRGAAYGFHRAMDHSGAVVGPLLATAILLIPGMTIAKVFLLSAIPGALAVAVLFFGINEKYPAKGASQVALMKLKKDWQESDPQLRLFLLAVFIFSLGQASDAFFLLKLNQAGVAGHHLPLAWAGLHVVRALSSHYLGGFSDRWGHKKTILFGWIYYVAILVGLGLIDNLALQLFTFIAFGIFSGLTEGPEKAMLSLLAKSHNQGTVFGYYYLILGVAALPASLIFGLLWEKFSAAFAFSTAIGCTGVAILILLLIRNRSPKNA
jgi:MFS family permease